MNDTNTLDNVMPSATPTEDEIAAWNALPRDEQVRRMKLALAHPDCSTVSTTTMAEIAALGQSLAAKLRDG